MNQPIEPLLPKVGFAEAWFARLDKRPVFAWIFAALWIAILVGIVAWFDLGAIGLVDETEPLFAEAARQMTVTGDWITPYFNEATRFDKPPLVYWLMAIAYKVIGVNEWSARFPSALAITGLTAFGFYTLRRFGFPRPGAAHFSTPEQAANASSPTQNSEFGSARLPEARLQPSTALWFSALIGSAAIALNPQTFLWSRTGVSDMLLNGCMGASLLAFFCGYAQPDRPKAQARWYLAFYVLAALAVLTKGPVGIVLPGLIILVFLLYVGKLRAVLQEMQLLRGILLFLLIAIPWFVAVIWINGEAYINSFFGYHNLERFTRVVNRHSAPLFFYFLVVPLSFLPWSVHLPVAMARLRVWQRKNWQQQPRSSHLGLFAFVWFAVIFVFFTIAVTKLPSYTIPLLPAAGILVGLFWSDQMTRSRSTRAAQISHWVNLALFVGLALATFYSPNWLGNDPELENLPDLLQQRGIAIWASVAWAIATIAAIGLLWRRQGRWLWLINLLGLIAFIWVGLIPTAFVVDTQRQLPLRQLATTIVQVQQPNEPIAMIGFGKPSLVFYTHRPIRYFPDTDGSIKDLQKLVRRNRNANSLLLIGRTVKLREAGLPPQIYQPIDQKGVYQLVRIKTADILQLQPQEEEEES